jgi:hypothetical protein
VSRLDRALRSLARRLPSSVRRSLVGTSWGARLHERLSQRADSAAALGRSPAADPPLPSEVTAAIADHDGWPRLLEHARRLVAAKQHTEAQSLVAEVSDRGGLPELTGLVGGVVASRQGRHALAVDAFDRAPLDEAVAYAPFELLTSLLAVDGTRGTALVRTLVDEERDLPAETWWVAVRHTFPTASEEDNALLVDRLEAAYRADPAAWSPGEIKIPWLRRWMGRERDATAPSPAAGTIPFGIVDYGQPDYSWASQNIGDYIQTIASLGHVVRHRNLTFGGPDAEVADLARELAGRVRPELQLDTASAELELHLVDRDASGYQAFPEDTWMLAFGWFMHPLFNIDGSFDFPLHPNLRPIFVSFHCNKRGLLTPEAIDYLREHGPIGCRDWTTVDLLLSLDVPAFFSGCLTTTVNTVFPDLEEPGPETGTVYVDVVRSEVPDGVENVPQRIPAIKSRTFSRNMRDAIELLEGYRRNFHDVVTMRLHCYLPARSIGMPVTFEPKHNADVRFNGLFRLSAEEFEAVRVPMRDRLQPVLEAIFSGAEPEDVRAVWRRVTADDVAAARRRHALPSAVVGDGRGLAPARSAAIEASAEAVDVVVAPAPGQLARLGPLLRSAADATTRPVRAWVLSTRRPDDVDGVEIRWVDTRRLLSERVSAEATALASVPELVAASRVVLLPVAAVVEGDLAELLAIDLADHAVAARDTSTATTSGFATLYKAGQHWDAEPDRAYEMYRDIHTRHRFDFDAFDTDVMVLDLERLRAQDATAWMLGAMARYRLTAREGWHYLLGPARVPLPREWAHVPTRDPGQSARLWFWADGGKPWNATVHVPERARWSLYAG